MKAREYILPISLSLVASVALQAQETTQPNVVFILIDDLGYSDVGYMGQKSVPTPNVDKLSETSINFTSAYAAAPVSSPTRASMITGLSPAELNLTCHIPGVGIERYVERLNKGEKFGEAHFVDHIDTEKESVATLMKRHGYNTAFFGKWHLAGEGSIYTSDGVINSEWHPDNYGFDVNIGGCSYGQPARYFSPYKNATISDGEEGEYLTDRLTDEAIAYMSENHPSKSGKPLYINLSYYTVHTPYQAPESTIEANGGDKYNAMIDKMDENVGRIMDALEQLGLRDNTIVIFTSDNGGVKDNPPLAGKKGDILEGGIRVPMLISWPGVISGARECSTPVYSVDIYPTLSQIAQLGQGEERASSESRSIYPIMTSDDSSSFEGRALYWHFPHHRAGTQWSMASAVRKGDWKLIYLFDSEEYRLFNLGSDLLESVDRQGEYPDVVRELKGELESWWQRVDAQMPTVVSAED